MEDTKKALISLVVPCYNEEAVFPNLEAELVSLADQLETEHEVELVFVDDGSRDSTWARIQSFAARDHRVRGLTLSRNFGHQIALSCGYEMARGDAIASLDADLQDPPEVILQMIEKWKDGADIVFAIRSHRMGETRLKLWTASLFYRLLSAVSAVDLKANAGDFRLVSRRALDALNSLKETHRFVRGMVGWLGFETADVYYARKPRAAGETKYPYRKLVRLALDAMVSFSFIPLRLTFIFAMCASMIVLVYLGISAIRFFFFDAELVPGWTSLIISITLFGALNLICVGIMGEYVGRTYEQVKNRPLYFVRQATHEAAAGKPQS